MSPHPLDVPEPVLRQWFQQALELSLQHVAGLDAAPAAQTEGGLEEAAALDADIPEHAQEAGPLLRRLVEDWVPRSLNTAGPGYLAYVPGGGLPSAAVADLISNLCNRYVGVFAAAPLLARLESLTLAWIARQFGYPEAARGVFSSGGSMANLSAVIAARHRLGPRFQDGVVYTSDQIHHSVDKAARLAGFLPECVRAVPSDEDGRLRIEALDEAIAADRRRGLRPGLVVGSAGTVNTGAVDDLAAMGERARAAGAWFHVDAAYGGFFQLTDRGRRRFAGIERADSITVDPHKGLFLPYGTGCLIVRDGEELRAPHASEADYMPAYQQHPAAQDFCEYSPELSRSFRGLRLWLSLQLHGAEAFRRTLDEKLDLADHAWRELAAIPELELSARPPLSLFAFRRRDDDDEGTRTQELARRLHARGRVLTSGTRFKGRRWQRVCILHFRTHRDRIDELLEALREEAPRLD